MWQRNQLTLLGTGSITIRATQPGNGSWLGAEPVERTFTVTANFDSWALEHFTETELLDLSLTGPNADFDGDGYRISSNTRSASTRRFRAAPACPRRRARRRTGPTPTRAPPRAAT